MASFTPTYTTSNTGPNTSTRRMSLRKRRPSNAAATRGISSADPQPLPGQSAISQSMQRPSTSTSMRDPSLPVSSIPFRNLSQSASTSNANARPSTSSNGDSEDTIGSAGSTRFPAGTLAFLEFGESTEPPKRSESSLRSSLSHSKSQKQHRLSQSVSSPPSTSLQHQHIGDDEFEALISGGQTRKMSLTPRRFHEAGVDTRAHGASASAPLEPFASFSREPNSSKTGRMQARTARPLARRAGEVGTDESSTEGEALDMLEYDEEDEAIFGPAVANRQRNKAGRKESLMDILNSEPPWAGPSPSERGSGKGAQIMGRGGDDATSSTVNTPRKFSPIANMDLLGSSTSSSQLRPTTATSIRPSTGASSNYDSTAYDKFPIPPERERKAPTLAPSKSSPNLSSSSASGSPSLPRRRLMAKDERAIRNERPDALIAFFNEAPPLPPPPAMQHEPTSPTMTMTGSMRSKGSSSSRFRNFLSTTSSRRPSLPYLSPNHPSSSSSAAAISEEPPQIDELGRLARQSSGPRKLNKSSTVFGGSRTVSPVHSRSQSHQSQSASAGLTSAEAYKAELAMHEMGREAVSRSQKREEEEAIRQYNGMYGELTRQQQQPYTASRQAHISSYGSVVQAGLSSSTMPSAPFVGSTVPMAPPATAAQYQGFSSSHSQIRMPPLPSQQSYTSTSTGHINAMATPLLTPEHSKDDLYSITQAGSTKLPTSTPLETPPATPYERRAAMRSASSDSHPMEDAVSELSGVRSGSPIKALRSEQPVSRRTSMIKRKAPPKAEFPEGEDTARAGLSTQRAPLANAGSSRVIGWKEQASSESVRATMADGGSSYHSSEASEREPRSREASASSFVTVSSAESPRPDSRTPQLRASQSAEAPASRPASTVLLNLPSRANSVSRGAAANAASTTQIHDILLDLRNQMALAGSVEDCLNLVDAAMFEIAYDVQSPTMASSNAFPSPATITEQGEGDASFQQASPPRRPVFFSSQITNRAYLALLEWFMLEEDERRIAYPKSFHRIEPTRTFVHRLKGHQNDTKAARTVSPFLESAEMVMTPSLGYSYQGSVEEDELSSDDEQETEESYQVERPSEDSLEVLQVKA